MCLQPRCPLFFRVNAGGFAAGGSLLLSLSYSAELLRLRPANHLSVSVATVPNSPNKTNTTSYPISKGMHCPECGRLSSRQVPLEASRCQLEQALGSNGSTSSAVTVNAT